MNLKIIFLLFPSVALIIIDHIHFFFFQRSIIQTEKPFLRGWGCLLGGQLDPSKHIAVRHMDLCFSSVLPLRLIRASLGNLLSEAGIYLAAPAIILLTEARCVVSLFSNGLENSGKAEISCSSVRGFKSKADFCFVCSKCNRSTNWKRSHRCVNARR